MKYLLVVLSFFMLASFPLLTACSDNTKHSQAVLSASSDSDANTYSNSNSTSYQTFDTDASLLGEFVDDLNNHQTGSLLDLFNEEATLTQVNQFNLGTTHSQYTSEVLTVTGIEQIKGWVEYQSASITRITPLEYKVSTNSVTLYGTFYFSNKIEDVRMDAQTQGGRFDTFYFYIEQISYN